VCELLGKPLTELLAPVLCEPPARVGVHHRIGRRSSISRIKPIPQSGDFRMCRDQNIARGRLQKSVTFLKVCDG